VVSCPSSGESGPTDAAAPHFQRPDTPTRVTSHFRPGTGVLPSSWQSGCPTARLRLEDT